MLMQYGTTLLLQLADGAGTSGYTNYIYGPSLTINAWNFVAVIVSRSSYFPFVTWYVNGALSSAHTNRTGSLVNNSPLRIGASAGSSPGNFFFGYMDELQMWNRALTQPEAQNIINAGSYGVCKP